MKERSETPFRGGPLNLELHYSTSRQTTVWNSTSGQITKSGTPLRDRPLSGTPFRGKPIQSETSFRGRPLNQEFRHRPVFRRSRSPYKRTTVSLEEADCGISKNSKWNEDESYLAADQVSS
ncbi:hypothetical protein RclHR1_00720019 [Rhizophagus clarus]|uniref:Uncharacterized protein n=1 Tax=Rhizophagus clarus TaxID=94130 RepID=A0A2Z6SBA7_9GLOM|nr:hypothetical protein RclHR1_00720019 [Rhizophagus clarus]